MAWWSAGRGDVIGDEPADVLQSALNLVAEHRRAAGQSKPSLKEILDSVVAAMHEDKGEIRQANSESVEPVSARVAGSETKVRSEESKIARDHTGGVIADAFSRISKIYELEQGRKPRSRELVEVLAFVLGYQPERYLADSSDIRELTIEERS
jgi:hypothetical protein